MKKVVAILLTVVFCLCLTSCGNETDEGKTQNNSDIEANSVYDTGVILSDNLDDFTFKINDIVYKLPIEIESFTKNGWDFPDYFDEYDKGIDSDHKELEYLVKGENEISVEIFNMSGNQKKLKECPIGRVEYDFSGDLQFYIAGDFLLNGKTFAEVKEKLGEPTSQDDYGANINAVYEKINSEWIYERYTFSFNKETEKISCINMVNFIETENAVNDSSDTAYLSKYIAPTSLGDDPNSFNVSIMGDLYTLPAPVREFSKNGWEIIESSYVGAGTYVDEGITMKKNGVTAKFGVFNFSKNQVDAKDATIYKIDVDNYNQKDIDLILSGNISLGTSKSAVEKSLNKISGFASEELPTDGTVYQNIQQKSQIGIHIFESGTVESIHIFRKECSYFK